MVLYLCYLCSVAQWKMEQICTWFSKLTEALGGKKKKNVWNLQCYVWSSAAVGENLCGVLELAKWEGTTEKLWCIHWCSSEFLRDSPIKNYPPNWPSLMAPGGGSGLQDEGKKTPLVELFPSSKMLWSKCFAVVLFYFPLQGGDAEAMGASYPQPFFHFVVHQEQHPGSETSL